MDQHFNISARSNVHVSDKLKMRKKLKGLYNAVQSKMAASSQKGKSVAMHTSQNKTLIN